MANQPTTTISTVQMDDGVRLHVKLIGDDATASAATKKKPLLIALHGAPGLLTHAEPEGSYAHLAGPALRVLVFDARGSGKSDLVGPYSHERWIRDIESLRYGNIFLFLLLLLGITSCLLLCSWWLFFFLLFFFT